MITTLKILSILVVINSISLILIVIFCAGLRDIIRESLEGWISKRFKIKHFEANLTCRIICYNIEQKTTEVILMIELKESQEGYKVYEIKCVKCGKKILENEVGYIDRSLVFADTYTVTLREVICPHCKYKYEEIGIT